MQQMQQQFEQQMGQMQQEMQRAMQELQRAVQENAQLKLANRDKGGDLQLRAEQQQFEQAKASAELDLEAQGVGLEAGRLELDAFAKVADLANPDRGMY